MTEVGEISMALAASDWISWISNFVDNVGARKERSLEKIFSDVS
jgi:hypothetical protein